MTLFEDPLANIVTLRPKQAVIDLWIRSLTSLSRAIVPTLCFTFFLEHSFAFFGIAFHP